ncbi:myosin head (motor domain) domain-containing protein [Toxoplasma gondii MAS]|uniref:Myosin head (Motor domain) domain-containing protein n=2 Tax=Toxoplasma gondii TaxID=5811 RepID=A0A086PY16_TOXGO|nr:myosin head (motor domain) domain-containing protein [Toxoplasma gondii MAS]PUA90317.1 myosin head (motor domain) domain-containing protein [Toxoplasma gondii TgCATBr9]
MDASRKGRRRRPLSPLDSVDFSSVSSSACASSDLRYPAVPRPSDFAAFSGFPKSDSRSSSASNHTSAPVDARTRLFRSNDARQSLPLFSSVACLGRPNSGEASGKDIPEPGPSTNAASAFRPLTPNAALAAQTGTPQSITSAQRSAVLRGRMTPGGNGVAAKRIQIVTSAPKGEPQVAASTPNHEHGRAKGDSALMDVIYGGGRRGVFAPTPEDSSAFYIQLADLQQRQKLEASRARAKKIWLGPTAAKKEDSPGRLSIQAKRLSKAAPEGDLQTVGKAAVYDQRHSRFGPQQEASESPTSQSGSADDFSALSGQAESDTAVSDAESPNPMSDMHSSFLLDQVDESLLRRSTSFLRCGGHVILRSHVEGSTFSSGANASGTLRGRGAKGKGVKLWDLGTVFGVEGRRKLKASMAVTRAMLAAAKPEGRHRSAQVIDSNFLGRVLIQSTDSDPRLRDTAEDSGDRFHDRFAYKPDPRAHPNLSVDARQEVVPVGCLLSGSPQDLEGKLGDLLYLSASTPAAVVDTLRGRFYHDEYFTKCGNMLISVFPPKNRERIFDTEFSEENRWQYYAGEIQDLRPHPFLLARRALENVWLKRRNQFILTFGELDAAQDNIQKELFRYIYTFAPRDGAKDRDGKRPDSAYSLMDEQNQRKEVLDAVDRLRQAFSITTQDGGISERCLDLVRAEFNSDNYLIGMSFVPNTALEANVELISCAARHTYYPLPVANICYAVLYGVHHQPDHPILSQTQLKPVDASFILKQLPPQPVLPYEEVQFAAYLQFVQDLQKIGLNETEITEFTRLISAALVADSIEQERNEDEAIGGGQRTWNEEKTGGRGCHLPPVNTNPLFAGRDGVEVLESILGLVPESLRDFYQTEQIWQIRTLSLKLFSRLRWWLLGRINDALRCRDIQFGRRTSIVLMASTGLDLRRLHSSWSLLQLMRNYLDECFLNLFVSWGFTIEEALYAREGVESPDVKYRSPREVLEILGGEQGIFYQLGRLHQVFEGEFVTASSLAAGNAAQQVVEGVLRLSPSPDVFFTLPGYEAAREKAEQAEEQLARGRGGVKDEHQGPVFMRRRDPGEAAGRNLNRRNVTVYQKKDSILGQFVVRHSTGQARYDARDFVSVNAAAYTLSPDLYSVLSRTKLALLRRIMGAGNEADELPHTLLRTDVVAQFQQLMNSLLLSDSPDPPECHFIASVNSTRIELPSVALANNNATVTDDMWGRVSSFTRSRTFDPAKKLRDAFALQILGNRGENAETSDTSENDSPRSATSVSPLQGPRKKRGNREEHVQVPSASSTVATSTSDRDEVGDEDPKHKGRKGPPLYWKQKAVQVPGFMEIYTLEPTTSEFDLNPSIPSGKNTSIMAVLKEAEQRKPRRAREEEKSPLFDYAHVWGQLADLQVLNYCTFQHQGMTVRLTFAEFLRLYAVLVVPIVYPHNSVDDLLGSRKPKEAVIYLLQTIKFPTSDYQLGRSLVFFRKRTFLVLEMQRAAYLRRVMPAVATLCRAWPTFRARLFRTEMHWLAVRVQSQARRIVSCMQRKEMQKVINFLTGVVIFGMHIDKYRDSNLTQEQIRKMETKSRDKEVYCLRWAATTFLQAWWRGILARKRAGAMRQELLVTFASQIIKNTWRRYRAQEVLLSKVELNIIPAKAATRIQAQVRRWICQRRYQRIRGLALALLSIRRKGSKLYGLRVQLNYTPIYKRTTVVRDMLSMKNSDAVVRIQSMLRMAYVRRQYITLRNAAMYCQAAAFTRIRRAEFLQARKAVIYIQRWWRTRKALLELPIQHALAPAPKLPKGSFSFLARRERTSAALLRGPLLASQGFFDSVTQRSGRHFLSLLDFQAVQDIRNIYPQTWAAPLLRLLEQIQAESTKLQEVKTAVEKGAALNLEQIEIGGQHSLVLLHQRVRVDKQDFGQKVASRSTGMYEEFAIFRPTVYAWGWNDRGQLGTLDTSMETDGLMCVGPLRFIDRQFRRYRDKKTGHLLHLLSHEIDYSYQVTWIGAGLDHCIAFVGDGLVFAWGDNRVGQCGLGHRITTVFEPQLIQSLKEQSFMAVNGSVGSRHTAIVAADGQCVIFGSGAFVALDTIPPDSNFYTPCRLPLPDDATARMVSCGFGFNIVMCNREPGVYGWGRNDLGQLGLGTEKKSVRDLPTFIPLPRNPSAPLVVEKVATGPDFVVVCISPAKACVYTWGVHLLTDPSAAASAPAAAVTGRGVRAAMNPFLKMQAAKTAAPKTAAQAPKPPFRRLTKLRAVCEPTLMTHPLWRGRKIVDVACGLREVMVLTDLGFVFGFQSSTVKWIEQEKPPEPEQTAATPTYSAFFKKKEVTPKEPEPAPKARVPSARFKPITGRFSLEPGLFSFRFCRPSRGIVKELRSSYCSVSCSTFWANSVKRTRREVDEVIAATESEVLKEQFSCTGDRLKFPPSIVAKAREEHKKIQEEQLMAHGQPPPQMKDFSPWPREMEWRQPMPDPRLVARMKAEYRKEAVNGPSNLGSDSSK